MIEQQPMNRFSYIFLFLFLIYLFDNQSIAKEIKPIPIQDNTTNLSILPSLQVLYPATDDLTFEQVSSEQFDNQFVAFDKEKNFFPEKNVVWVRFSLENKSNKSNWLLDLATQYDSVALYITNEEKKILKGYTDGSLMPFESRVKYYGFFSYLPLDLPTNATQIYYARIAVYKPITLQNLGTLKLANNLSIQNEKEIAKEYEQRKYFGSAFTAIYFIMTFYTFVLFLNLKDKGYLYFSLLLLSSFLVSLLTLDFFGNVLDLNRVQGSYVYFIIIILPWSFQLLFAREYLKLKIYTPLWDKIVLGLLGIIGFYYLLTLLNIWIVTLTVIISLTAIVVTLIVGVIVFLRGYKPAFYFLLANIFYLAGRLAGTLAIFQVITSKFLMLNASTIGGIAQIFLFSVGLFYRLQEIQRELVVEKEARQKLIEQQKELLEAEVQERNKEIEQQKRVLKEKNEELASSEEELKQNMEELEANQEMIKHQKDTLEKAFEELEHQNLRITDSIRYAQRIQGALLPHESILATHFQEHFVVFKPKDVVSGDFYWFEQVSVTSEIQQQIRNNKQGTVKKFLAVVDCTGHGVPGAFMSMIGNTLLNEIIKNQRIYEPSLILEELNKGIVSTLNQQQSQYLQDGMDVALCSIEEIENQQFMINFSGAKRPFLYFSDGKLHEIEGTKKAIGQTKEGITYQNHTLILQKNDTIYLKTDGVRDIINKDRNRFGSKRFREILRGVAYLPLQSQKEVILSQINDFQGDSEQRDDILVIGVKL
jgi:two-component system, sensor histidine kinase LadS